MLASLSQLLLNISTLLSDMSVASSLGFIEPLTRSSIRPIQCQNQLKIQTVVGRFRRALAKRHRAEALRAYPAPRFRRLLVRLTRRIEAYQVRATMALCGMYKATLARQTRIVHREFLEYR